MFGIFSAASGQLHFHIISKSYLQISAVSTPHTIPSIAISDRDCSTFNENI
jgi:hypothetical protein